jgi:uncharacterized protein YcfJ
MQTGTVPQARGRASGRLYRLALLLPVALVCGCSTMSNAERGTLGGGAIGAGTGALVGHAVGNTGAGAVIGGAVGALSGALVGDSIDESERKQEARLAAATAAAPHGPLGLTDVVTLAQQHVSDGIIVGQIRSTGSVFNLSTNDIIWLRQNGVSEYVISEMQATVRGPRRVYTAVPVYPQPVYVVEPPPPPVRVGLGFGFTHIGR